MASFAENGNCGAGPCTICTPSGWTPNPFWGIWPRCCRLLTGKTLGKPFRKGLPTCTAACHTYLYATDLQSPLPELGKSAFFCLRFFALLRDGTYHPTYGELLEVLEGPSKELLSLPRTAQQAASLSPQETRRAYGLLMGWCSQILRKGMGQFQQQGSPAEQPKR